MAMIHSTLTHIIWNLDEKLKIRNKSLQIYKDPEFKGSLWEAGKMAVMQLPTERQREIKGVNQLVFITPRVPLHTSYQNLSKEILGIISQELKLKKFIKTLPFELMQELRQIDLQGSYIPPQLLELKPLVQKAQEKSKPIKVNTLDAISEIWKPTPKPTEQPTEIPTPEPKPEPTESPTEIPTPEPTEPPTEIPTPEPTEPPTEIPKAKEETDDDLIIKINIGKRFESLDRKLAQVEESIVDKIENSDLMMQLLLVQDEQKQQRQLLESILEKLTAYQPTTPTQTQTQPTQTPTKSKKKFLVCNLLPIQNQELIKEFPQVEFTFIDLAKNPNRLKSLCESADLVFGSTSFMNHSSDANLMRFSGEKYVRYVGATSALKRIIYEKL